MTSPARNGRDPAFAQHPAVLSDGAVPVPLSARSGGAQGVHPSGGGARVRAQRPAHPWRLPPQPVDRLPAGMRELPRLRLGARGGGRLPPHPQHAPHPRPQRRPRRRDAGRGAHVRAIRGVPLLPRRPPPRRRHGRHVSFRLLNDAGG